MDGATELERLVVRRQTSLDYLKRCHARSVQFLNVARLVRGRDERGEEQARAEADAEAAARWIALGLSVARIARMPAGEDVVRACAQLREEFAHFVGRGGGAAGATAPPPPAPRARPHSPGAPAPAHVEPVRAALVKAGRGGAVVYRYLHTPSIPFDRAEADVGGVVFSLCEVLSLLYSKFLEPVCAAPPLAAAVERFDAAVQEHFIEPLVERLMSESLPAIDAELDKLSAYVGSSTGRRIALRRSSSRGGSGGALGGDGAAGSSAAATREGEQ